MQKILISEKVAEETIDYLITHGIEIKYGRGVDHETICEDIQDCDAVMVRIMCVDKDIIESAPKLKVIAKHGVGCDTIDVKAASERGIFVVYAPGSNSLSVAEHTMTLMLSCAHCIREANMEYARGNYNVKDELFISEISGKALGLIGCGNVALHVGRMAHFGFNMKVLGYDHVKKEGIPEYIHMTDSVDDLITESDFISLHIPGTQDNINYFDIQKFKLMKKKAILINTARGEVLDTQALIESLEKNRILGAGLDVSNPEPTTSDSELFGRKDVLLTPHIGAASRDAMIRMGLIAAEGVVDVLNGRKPRYIYMQ